MEQLIKELKKIKNDVNKAFDKFISNNEETLRQLITCDCYQAEEFCKTLKIENSTTNIYRFYTKTIDDMTHSINLAFQQNGFYFNVEIYYDFENNCFKFGIDKNDKITIIKSYYALANLVSNIKKSKIDSKIIDLWNLDEKELQRVKNIFTENSIQKMMNIKNCSNPGDWRWGDYYYKFNYNDFIIKFRAYERDAYCSVKTPCISHFDYLYVYDNLGRKIKDIRLKEHITEKIDLDKLLE